MLKKKWGIYLLRRERNIYIDHPSQRGPRSYVGFEQAFIFLIRKINAIFSPQTSWAPGKSQDFEHHSSLNFSSVFGTHFLNFHPVFLGTVSPVPFHSPIFLPAYSVCVGSVFKGKYYSCGRGGSTNSVPNTHIGWLTTTYEYSRFRHPLLASNDTRTHVHMLRAHTHTCIHTHTQCLTLIPEFPSWGCFHWPFSHIPLPLFCLGVSGCCCH